MLKIFRKEKTKTLENEVLSLRGAHAILQYTIDNNYQPSSIQSRNPSKELIFVKKGSPSIAYNIEKGRARVLVPDDKNVTVSRLVWLYLSKANELGYEPNGYSTAYAPYFIQRAYAALTGDLLLTEEFKVFNAVTCPEELLSLTYKYRLGMSAEAYARRHAITLDAIWTNDGKDYYSAPNQIEEAIKYAIIMTMYLERNVSRYELNNAVNHGFKEGDTIPNYHFFETNPKDIEYVIKEFDLIVANIDKI